MAEEANATTRTPMKFEIGMTYEILATVVNPRDSGNMRVQIGGQEVLLSADALERAIAPSAELDRILPDLPDVEPAVTPPTEPPADPPLTPATDQYVVTMDAANPTVREGETQNP